MSNLKVVRAGEMPFKSFVFPSGEIGVKIGVKERWVSYTAKTGVFAPAPYQTIVARLQNSNDIMELFMLVDALKRIDNTPIRLFLLKIPYSQQDRVCDLGESLSLKVFADLVNSLNFERVTVFDPHSDVVESVFKNLKTVSRVDIINKWLELINVAKSCKIVAPDVGANKKTVELAKFLYHNDFVRADKLRDLTNGEIKETIVYCNDFKGQDVLIPDDICLGGRTFIELAKVIKTRNCGKIHLFVTHGVFNNGIKPLVEGGIDCIWTANSWQGLAFSSNFDVRVLNLEEKFKDLI